MKKTLCFFIATIFCCTFVFFFLCSKSSFASGNCAFSCGYGYENVNMSSTVKNVCNYTGKMGYHAYYSTDGTTNYILDGTFKNGTKRLESDLIFLTGHGAYNLVQTTRASGLKIGKSNFSQYSGHVGTESKTWSNVKLAVFLACNTGQGSENIAFDVFKKSGWKITSMGWRNEIQQGDAEKWAGCFYKKLYEGATIDQAMAYAGSQRYDNGNIKDLSFYGNGGMVVSKNKNLKIDLKSNTKAINKKKIIAGDDLKKQIIEYMYEYNQYFDPSNYDINIYNVKQDGSFIIVDLIYKIGKYFTNSQYSLIIQDGYVTLLTDNTITQSDIQKKILKDKKLDEVNEDLYKKARNVAKDEIIKKLNEKNLILVDESTSLFLDLFTNKKYIHVIDTFKYNNETTAVISDSYNFEI